MGKKFVRRSAPVAVSVLLSAAVAVASTDGASAFGVNNHEGVTAAALREPDVAFPFLRPAVQDDILDEHEQMDRPPLEGGVHGGLDDWHFDDCELDGAADFITDRYEDSKIDLSGRSPFGATDEFGSLLHTIQDFYAHANWVEFGFPKSDDPGTPQVEVAQADLVDLSGAQQSLSVDWFAPAPAGLVRPDVEIAPGVVRDVLLGSDDLVIPADWEVREEGFADDVPTLFDGKGDPLGVLLMTGEGWQDDECDVHNNYGTREFNGYEHDETLNKDGIDRPGFEEAYAMAVLQTSYEWCRMMSRAGSALEDGLVAALWVRSGGNPHPAATPCSAQPPGRTEVTVTFEQVRVLDDGDSDDNAPGEVSLAVALYDSPFKFNRSVHKQSRKGRAHVADGDVVPVGGWPEPATLCLDHSDSFTVAVHGWDDDDEPEHGGIYANDYDDKGNDDELLYGFQQRFAQSALNGDARRSASNDLEVEYRLTTGTDSDEDGLEDCDEQVDGTEPLDPDTDDDGLTDGEEVGLGTDPIVADSDDDGVADGVEVDTGSDPLDADSDDDGLDDGAEVGLGTDPTDADSDDDELIDGVEVGLGTDPLDADSDDDGLVDGMEIDQPEAKAVTDPLDADSDDDGLADGGDVEFVETAVDNVGSFRSLGDGSKQATIVILEDVERALLRDDRAGALRRLGNLRRRIDGCGAVPDPDDWILDCGEQRSVRYRVDLLSANLSSGPEQERVA